MAFRLAHFSDFHLIRIDDEFRRCLALIDDAIASGAEHIVITGDIVECGQLDVVEAFMDSLSRRGWGTADRLTVIPGNHDIFPASVRALPTLRRPTTTFERFTEITRRTRSGRGVHQLVAGEAYPFGKIITPDIVLAGMDTTRIGQWNPLRWAEGELQSHHQEAVTKFFSQHRHARHRILAMHHHPWEEQFVHGWLGQNFKNPPPEEVEAWVKECGATLVLCGHVHASSGIEVRKLGKNCKVLRCGAAGGLHEESEEGKLRVYHLINLGWMGDSRVLRQDSRDHKARPA